MLPGCGVRQIVKAKTEKKPKTKKTVWSVDLFLISFRKTCVLDCMYLCHSLDAHELVELQNALQPPAIMVKMYDKHINPTYMPAHARMKTNKQTV